ncbi:glycosyltransferase [Flavobacterium psychrolimnae]|uniref:Glycosyltransferase family 1 protein n=1 Tax=Flavobacterium psychrolimnae TaxID=249351 RepID=A0A366AZJ2_9FLAO|nr:glycosyltransferase [Flavobacterium psychrolimnae]RBN50289.1 glycosyltransferase family 1 protein [Flavobacterium psychrolimnae]
MKFVIITHVPHIKEENKYYAYAPYVREMNVWGNYVEEVLIVAPIASKDKTAIDCAYNHPHIKFNAITNFDILNFKSIFNAFFKIPGICWHIFIAMKNADHIHLRCPGNIGLLGCIVQILFSNTPKTAKYAGNWDPKSKQPWTYRLQKWILSNSFLTRNMQVLVYGEWEGSSRNIKPFFTATYSDYEKMALTPKALAGRIDFVFVGTLVKGKQPLYAIQLIERLHKKGYLVRLRMYGEGVQRKILEDYIIAHKLESIITLEGNQSKTTVQQAYQDSHFVVLPSDSEGWPKVIAEGMFWGCVPIATSVSCVPFMLDYGSRGVLLGMNLEHDSLLIEAVLQNQTDFDSKLNKAADWSRSYTLEVFHTEIKKLILP